MSKLSFLREGIRHIKTTGTIFRSGSALCRAAIDRIDFEQAHAIVELGAGDGVITEYILKRMRPDAVLIAFELSSDLCDNLRAIDDERLIVAEASAEALPEWLKEQQIELADAIISAIPFAALPAQVGQNILDRAHEHLRPGGLYNQVHYSLKRLPWYQATFKTVEKNRVWANVPPAWVLYCKKAS
ncbi:MAG: methyltransferase domain-containing protein [Bacteroidota bacterium]